MVATGPHVRAVGWLHPAHPFPTGEVSLDFLVKLKEFPALSGESADALWFGASCGFHECEYCNDAIGIGNFGVPCDGLLFVAPEMIVHYVEKHSYHPSVEFIDAVLRSPLPGSDQYALMTEPFCTVHKRAHEELQQQAIFNAGRWAVEQGGGKKAIADAAIRFFGNNSKEMCERIRSAISEM